MKESLILCNVITSHAGVNQTAFSVNSISNDCHQALAGVDAPTITPDAGTFSDPITVSIFSSTAENGGELTVEFSANGQAEDWLGIRQQGNNRGQFGVSDGNATYQGMLIDSFTDGIGASPLVVTFNSSATPQIAKCSSETLPTRTLLIGQFSTPRTIQFTASDGDGGTSLPKPRTISITPMFFRSSIGCPDVFLGGLRSFAS